MLIPGGCRRAQSDKTERSALSKLALRSYLPFEHSQPTTIIAGLSFCFFAFAPPSVCSWVGGFAAVWHSAAAGHAAGPSAAVAVAQLVEPVAVQPVAGRPVAAGARHDAVALPAVSAEPLAIAAGSPAGQVVAGQPGERPFPAAVVAAARPPVVLAAEPAVAAGPSWRPFPVAAVAPAVSQLAEPAALPVAGRLAFGPSAEHLAELLWRDALVRPAEPVAGRLGP